MKFTIAFSILILSFSVVLPAQAQVGTMKWHFQRRSDVISALKSTRGNILKTYEVLTCAGRQGFCNTSIAYYENVAVGKQLQISPEDNAAYAFAFDIGYSFRPWSWKIDPDKTLVKKSNSAQAELSRERGAALKSPVVLIMNCMYNLSLSLEDRKSAYDDGRLAIKKSPNWADAYYWTGRAACSYALGFTGDVWPILRNKGSWNQRVHLGNLAMRSFNRAEQIDPGLKPYLYLDKAGAAELMASPSALKLIPTLVEKQLTTFPSYAAAYQKMWGKSVDQFRHDWDMRVKTAAETAQKAKSSL